VEASTLRAPRFGRVSLPPALLRLRSDEQLLSLFRAGSDEAFGVLHERYRQRLFAYVRQMLSSGSRQDAEDVMQDVFVRAFRALRGDEREVNVKAWLYRVAHNRCIDHLRRPEPPPAELIELHSRKPLHDPLEEAERREHLKQLVRDVGNLPPQQRSALLMREMDGLSYVQLAGALEVTVPAVKSLLVRARVGLVEAAEARDTDCAAIRRDLVSASDRGVKAPSLARRHMRECASCREYRVALRGVRRGFAALAPPAAAGPLALLAQALGVGGAGGGAITGGGAVVGGGGATATTALIGGGGVAGTAACKVAAVVCASAALTGGAAEVKRLVEPAAPPARAAAARPAPALAAPAAPMTSAVLDGAPAPLASLGSGASEPAKAPADAVPAPAQEEAEPALVLGPLLGKGEAEETPPALDAPDATAPVLVLPADDAPGGVAAPVEEPAAPAPPEGSAEPAPAPVAAPAPAPEPATAPAAERTPAAADPRPAAASGAAAVDPALTGGTAAP